MPALSQRGKLNLILRKFSHFFEKMLIKTQIAGWTIVSANYLEIIDIRTSEENRTPI